MTVVAIRHPKRGKAHRAPGIETRRWDRTSDRDTQAQCGAWCHEMTQRLLLADVAPEDRCRRCWPEEVAGS